MKQTFYSPNLAMIIPDRRTATGFTMTSALDAIDAAKTKGDPGMKTEATANEVVETKRSMPISPERSRPTCLKWVN